MLDINTHVYIPGIHECGYIRRICRDDSNNPIITVVLENSLATPDGLMLCRDTEVIELEEEDKNAL
jgi:hypothetical protein